MEYLVLFLKAAAFTAGARDRTELGEMNPEFSPGCSCSCDLISLFLSSPSRDYFARDDECFQHFLINMHLDNMVPNIS